MGLLHTTAHARTTGFEALYRRHFELVWSLTGHFGVPTGARDDVAQEVWMTIHRRLTAIDSGASTRAWVAAITRNVALHHHRTHARRSRKHEALSHVVLDRTMPDALEQRTTIDRSLGQLDDEQREVFLLVAVEELTGPEVSEILGIPVNTVYSRLRLARARLARIVTSLEDERRIARTLHERPTAATQHRIWVLLALEPMRPVVVPHATSSVGGKLLVAATSALVTVLATVATSGSVGRSAHATPSAAATIEQRVDEGPEVALLAAVAVDASGDAPRDPGAVVDPAVDHAPGRAVANDARAHEANTSRDASPPRTAKPRAHANPSRAAETREPVASPPPAAPEPAPADTLAAEARLLGAARRAITAGDKAAALALLDRHASEYPSGALARDREAARTRLQSEPAQ